jgi:hypothetical protein
VAFRDNVKETSTTTGTGSLTLAGAVSTFETFAARFAVGDRVHYRIESSGTEWEVGIGTLTASSTLSREQVLSSSNANALVNFSAGSKNVYCTLPASTIVPPGVIFAMHGGFCGR